MDYASFWCVLRSRPLAALAALYWHATGRKVRARNRLRIILAQGPEAYQLWIDRIELRDNPAADTRAVIAGWPNRPLFSIVAQSSHPSDEGAYDRLAAMLEAQNYPHWELLTVSNSPPRRKIARGRYVPISGDEEQDEWSVLRAGVLAAQGPFVIPLPPNVQLPPTALFHYAEALQGHPDAVMLFGDQDQIDDLGARHSPWFKPQWNAELILAQDYVTRAVVVSCSSARKAFRDDQVSLAAPSYALAIAVASSAPTKVRHVAFVQAHVTDDTVSTSQGARLTAVGDHLLREGNDTAVVSADRHGIVRVNWQLPATPPLISVIVPTRDKMKLLRACISSLLESTCYPRFEVIVVDNGSRAEDALAYLDEIARHPAVRVLRDDRPYNFSQLNNLAARHAEGEYLCLLNNDTEIIDSEWLEALVRQARRPEVGAVGARLLYDDGTIQHAGVTIGLGAAAGHAHRFQKRDEIGYHARTHAAHFVSAVTAACLVVEKAKFFAVGGLDEQSLAIAFNDVDLCLKLEKAGWFNLYTPYATLLHHESKSRGRDTSRKHIERFERELAVLQRRWNTDTYQDPLHHPHLDRSTETFLIRL